MSAEEKQKQGEKLLTIVSRHMIDEGDTLRLIADGAALDCRDITGSTALIWACYWGHFMTAAALIDAGADINVIDSQYQTPLMLAAAKGETAIAKNLLARGCRIDNIDEEKMDARAIAVRFGHFDIVKLIDEEVIARRIQAEADARRLHDELLNKGLPTDRSVNAVKPPTFKKRGPAP